MQIQSNFLKSGEKKFRKWKMETKRNDNEWNGMD